MTARNLGFLLDLITDLLLFVIPSAIIGSKFYYVVFNFNDFKDNLLSIFNTRTGGLAIYGAIISAILTIYSICAKKEASYSKVA